MARNERGSGGDTFRRAGRIVLLGLGGLVLLAVIAVLVLTNTPWGREQVREIVLGQLQPVVEGQVEIGRIDGNLLREPHLRDVTIVDREGRPFLDATSVSVRYSIPGLLRQRIILSSVELTEVHVVLDAPPGEEWNFARIFDPEPEVEPDPEPGWGDWVELRDVRLSDSRVTLRMEWEPAEELSPAEQEEEIRRALEGETREAVTEVPGGYQSVMDFRALDAHIPRVLAAHPDTADIPVKVASLRTIAQPFRPPSVEVRDFSGSFRIGEDLVRFEEVAISLPGTHLQAEGRLALDTGEGAFEVSADPLSLADLRFLHPPLPAEVEGHLRVGARLSEAVTHVVAEEIDFRVGEGWMEGRIEGTFGDTLRVEDTRLRFADIETTLLEELVPGFDAPEHGRISGDLAAHSEPERPAEATRVDAWVQLDETEGPSSRVEAEGIIELDEEPQMEGLTVRLAPLQASLVRGFAPDVQVRGAFEGTATLDGPARGPFRLEGSMTHRDPLAGTSRLSARGGADLRDELRLVDLLVSLEPVQLALARDALEDVPEGATLTGFLRLDGPPGELLQVESDLALEDPATGTSRIGVRGGVGMPEEVLFDSFEVELSPFLIPTLGAFFPDLPLSGILQGTVRLDGSPAQRLAFSTDLAHEDGEEHSHIEGQGELSTAEDGRISADLVLHELSLVTVGRFAPEADLRGSASGYLRAEGIPEDLAVQADLELPEGHLESEASLDRTGEEPEYELHVRLDEVNLAALSGRTDEVTAIGGTVAGEGRGTELPALRGSLLADLTDRGPGRPRLLHAAAHLDDGRAVVDSFALEADGGEARVRGTFGLTGDRDGELEYRIAIDSLHLLQPFMPDGGGMVEPRPAVQEAALEEREAELREVIREGEVEMLATGETPALPEPSDTLDIVGVRADVLAGWVEVVGAAQGNLEEFDVTGSASVRDLLAAGQALGEGSFEFAVRDVGAAEMTASLTAEARSLRVAGFAYDSLFARLDYRQSEAVDEAPAGDVDRSGELSLTLHQDDETWILADGGFELRHGTTEIRLDDLALHFPDDSYRTPAPTVVRWSERALEVETLTLESDRGARVHLDGRLPAADEGELDLLIDDLEIAHMLALLQERPGVEGGLHIDAPIRGTMAEPRFEAEASITRLHVNGEGAPEALAHLEYSDQMLTADLSVADPVVPPPVAEVEEAPPTPEPEPLEAEDGTAAAEEDAVMTVAARIPMDLALTAIPGPRFPPEPIEVDARLHDLSLGRFAAFTDQVEAVQGEVAGHLSVTGTVREPEIEGAIELVAPTLFVVPLGIRISDMTGVVRVENEALVVDSLVAHSGGPLRVTGEVDLSRFTAPAFDLALEARNTRVMDTEDVRMRLDADLTVTGPMEAVEIAGGVRTRSGVVRIPETRELAAPGPLDLEDPATFERVDQVLVATRDALIDPPIILENLRTELQLHIDRDFWIRSTELNVEIYTPPAIGPLAVRLNGIAARDIALEGTVNTGRGEYEFMGRRFDLARGSVTFVGGTEIDPLIRLTAEHEVQLPGREAFDIRIIVDGTLMELETQLESTAQPPISQTDLVSLVVFGREAGSLLQQHGSVLSGQGSGGGPLVGNVAARATQQFAAVGMEALVNELETETARALSLDVLHIQPADAPSEIFTGRALDVLRGTEVQAGRYVTPRLFLSGQARPTFVHPGARVEYETDGGYLWRTSWRPRFLPAVPTLAEESPDRASVFSSFLFREWRF